MSLALAALPPSHALYPSTPPSRPPLASPTKRSYRSSPTSSPDPSGAQENERILRTRLDSGEGGAEVCRVEIKLDNVAPLTVDGADGCGTPNTPPEEPVEPLAGLGVIIEGGKGPNDVDACTAPSFKEVEEGATQTATAERQTQELREMSNESFDQLARLCSQHWMSDYNTLKRAVAAAANETRQPAASARAPAVAMPSFPPIPRVPSFPSSAATAAARPAALSRSLSEHKIVTKAATPAKKPDPASASSTLTPALSSFAFNPTPSTSTPSTPSTSASSATSAANQPVQAEAVTSLLADLVAGEPVSVERTSPHSVVLSEPVVKPSPAAPAPVPTVPGLLPGMVVMNGVAVKTSVSHPINISPLIPPELLPVLSAHLFSHTPHADNSTPSTSSPFFLRPTPSTDLLTLCDSLSCFPHTLSSESTTTTSTVPQMGNFLLSSCPGKKVRLTLADALRPSPTTGSTSSASRGAICRDVRIDLARARDTQGVRLVICCLDDVELAYLGVPWQEYKEAAKDVGVEVVRMPMVEGFAPESPSFLDERLDRIVKEYTLKGESVLAHCRGGIGRAGLVASCWMVKMGLVEGLEQGGKGGPGATMRTVERTVELIRKRRSVKAIETAHQVHFLMQYITYLQEKGHSVPANALLA
ncbi:hypothetical protein JCM11251_007548 [Rhodosporidiobolus azoricus]